MKNVEHNLQKELIENIIMSEICGSIPSLVRDWCKSESPDWVSEHDIGLEIISEMSKEWREIFGYKSPIGKTVAEIAEIDYEFNGCATCMDANGDVFKYYIHEKEIVIDSITSVKFEDLDEEAHEHFDCAVCFMSTRSSTDIGSEIYDYIDFVKEGFGKKVEKLNNGKFKKFGSNRLAISYPDYCCMNGKILYGLMEEMIHFQREYETKFDTVYLKLFRCVVVFNLASRMIDLYWLVSPNNLCDLEENVRKIMKASDNYHLVDVMDIPNKENVPFHINECTPDIDMINTWLNYI